MANESVVITVENVSKQYRLGQVGTGTLSHDLNRWWHRVRGKDDPYLQVGGETQRPHVNPADLWALSDVSFSVKQGEILGIIGKNGAGKSTLLKILSRVTAPTNGQIKVKGRIASLLEVGTGFHPELTGRENIFLNGAILGMRRTEIISKFDEIVAFAEVERFIDTPVKRYSSGMYVRLAFAVAAHLEPEILIIDEVLAVGDMAFQKKCLGRMSEVAHGGRTVLFVSHNLEAVRKLCSRGVLMERGRLVADGRVDTILSRYLDADLSVGSTYVVRPPTDTAVAVFATQVHIETLEGSPANGFPVAQPWQVRVAFRVLRRTEHVIVAIGLVSDRGVPVWTTWSPPRDLEPGCYEAVFRNERTSLCTGSYAINVGVSTFARTIHYTEEAAVLAIAEVSDDADALRVDASCGMILDPMSVSVSPSADSPMPVPQHASSV
jgi:lipopolysaccharide transport system ATP-binding protein